MAPTKDLIFDVDSDEFSDHLPEDHIIQTSDVDKSTKLILKFDKVLGDVYVRISKTTEKGERELTLNAYELDRLMTFKSYILTLSQRYSGNDLPVNFTFRLSPALKVKLNFSGFGSLDIRRYFTDGEGNECPTRKGVRFHRNVFSVLFESLSTVHKIQREITEKSNIVFRNSWMALMVREMRELDQSARVHEYCEACEIDDPSQDHHDCFEKIDWSEVVELYHKVAEGVIKRLHITTLAKKVANALNISFVENEDPIRLNHDDIAFMKDEKNFTSDELFATCAKLCNREE
ncbi:hypothetical protein [Solemya elarraichensis gill symbiont]|uniref:Uncharacterized protein n=1 Tax=Solemya elarraichensis gill symbiont TaxID=1918949 RepID=A0A1T2KZ43_9GAMM|nr:hypothetical protein [Solemya elarraichensis gill symbiont]OOZ38115.1 hypothetical protein BOW52_09270 [Solemya elarraichensis gill symbiont]